VQRAGYKGMIPFTNFIELFEFVVNALEYISNWNDSSATDATLLLKSIDSEFIISVCIVQVKKIYIYNTYIYLFISI
jgi:hypothetical protein